MEIVEQAFRAKLLAGMCAMGRVRIGAEHTWTGKRFITSDRFIESLWTFCAEPSTEVRAEAKKIYALTEKLLINEEDSSAQEMLANYAIYALADLAYAISEQSVDAAVSPCEFVLEQIRFWATQSMLSDFSGATILTDTQVNQIENSNLIAAELTRQGEERDAISESDLSLSFIQHIKNRALVHPLA